MQEEYHHQRYSLPSFSSKQSSKSEHRTSHGSASFESDLESFDITIEVFYSSIHSKSMEMSQILSEYSNRTSWEAMTLK
jgi:hypothetical protein